jgi:hypothetical protein
MKNYIYITAIAFIISVSGFVGYKIGVSQVKDNTISVIQTESTKQEVIKVVNRKDPKQVNKALDAPIEIDAKFSGVTDGFIFADIYASDTFKSAKAKYSISVNAKPFYNTLYVGYGVYLVNKEIFKAPNLMYSRSFANLSLGCNLIFNVWDTNKIYGIQANIGYSF